ncbi:uncharacterized protein LOC120838093 [Ixodes scapularis]|uniref:uncharacterized protein LOC120838093 n=1 Tax=Ixodes scapularis TaxID=6945 RepID=UPI001C38D470|nr:uncharacterized protein LOC120838093 [Ixodes scapularis]
MKDLLRSKDKLRDVCDGLNLQTFQERDLAFIAEYCEILQPIASALTQLQAQSDCFFGELLPTLFTLKSMLQEKAGMDFVYCRPLLDAVTFGFIRRFDELLRMKPSANEATVAAVLHPYFKLWWLSREPQDVREHGQQLTEKAVIDFVNATKHTTRHLACAPSTSAASDVSADAFFSFEAHCGTSPSCQEDQVKLEFLSYLQDPRVEFDMLRSYPSLRSAFIRYNTPTCSSAPVERLFSFASLILRPHRGGLSDRCFEQMLLLKAAVPRVPS